MHAPRHQFGVGLMDLRIEQGFAQLQSLLDYIGTDHKIGRVMLISLRHLQIEAGVSFDLLDTPSVKVTYLTDCWLVSLQIFCGEFNVSLRVKDNRIPQVSRLADQMLMDAALEMKLTRQEMDGRGLHPSSEGAFCLVIFQGLVVSFKWQSNERL